MDTTTTPKQWNITVERKAERQTEVPTDKAREREREVINWTDGDERQAYVVEKI